MERAFILGALMGFLGIALMSSHQSTVRTPASVGWTSSAPKIKPKNEIRVMVIDSGIASHNKLNKFIQREENWHYEDEIGHGTHVSGVIAMGNGLKDPVCDQVKIYSCRYFVTGAESGGTHLQRSVDCAKAAVEYDMDIINYSGGGSDSDEEYNELKKFKGTLVTAAGNEKQNLALFEYYPASYAIFAQYQLRKVLKNIVIVQAVDEKGKLMGFSNYYNRAVSEVGDNVFSTIHKPVNGFGKMRGTSQATAIHTHKMLKQMCEDRGYD